MTWVWATTDDRGDPALVDPLAPGRVAFVDGGDGPVLWGRSYGAGPGAERRAAGELAATAAACVTAAAADDGRTVRVTGRGLLAHLVRELLPDEAAEAGPADVVIETTGSADRIAAATAGLPRLGRLVLAGPPRPDTVELATYRDVHVRGLTLAGVPWASGAAAPPEAVDEAARRLAAARWFTGPGGP